MYWIIICHLSGGLCQPRTSRGVEYPSSQWPGSVLSSRDSDKGWNLLVKQADSTFLTPHSMLMAAVSLCFRSPSQPWGVHREPCFTHTQEQSQTMWGKRPAYSLETLHWAELWCFNLWLTYKDTNEHERRQLGQRSEHQLCRKDSRGWGEPTERITGRDTKTVRVWITEASEWERFWGSGRLPDSHPQEGLLSSKIPPRGFMPQGHL